MDKNVSIVRVDTRHYRVIARENWGLTKQQMKGMHVHHRIKRSDGGTNDPSNLFVCSEWFHDNVWHADEGGFTGLAVNGGRKGGLIGGPKAFEIGAGLFSRTPSQVSEDAAKAGSAGSRSQIQKQIGMFSPGFFRSDEHRARARQLAKLIAERTSKPVIVVLESGEEFAFSSFHDAAKQLGLNRIALVRLAKSGRVGHKRPYRGMKVYFKDKDLN